MHTLAIYRQTVGQVLDLEQAMEKCVYAESIVADLLKGTGETQIIVKPCETMSAMATTSFTAKSNPSTVELIYFRDTHQKLQPTVEFESDDRSVSQ